MNTIIKNGRLIDPANEVDGIQTLCIQDGKIAAIGRVPDGFNAQQVIDATGQVICPGLVDMRVRLREPGYKEKGSIQTETQAAVAAGVTSVCCPPDTIPVVDSPSVVEWIHQRAEHTGKAKVHIMGALTQGLDSDQISAMWALKKAGCVGLSNAYKPVRTAVMRRAMEYAASQEMTVFLHAEEDSLSGSGCMHEGVVNVRLGLDGIPESAETIAVTRDLQLIALTGVRAHFCHISTAAAVRMIARAQFDGLPVTADVASYQLFLTEMDVADFNTQCHVRPPLRTQRDSDGLRQGLAKNTLSVITSDHQPHDVDAKLAPFPSSEPGISSIETLLPLTLRLVDERLLDLSQAIKKLTIDPARILGITAGSLGVGDPADVCIFDAEKYWRLSIENMYSYGKNSPFLGWDMKGQVTHTFVNGQLIYQLDQN